jgi:isopentenyl-diphosphate delta-isomerase
MNTEPERENVILVAGDGTPIGLADKRTVHSSDTPLHLAFSCHVFDEDGRVLVTRRSLQKLTWPGVWTNSFCGHPAPGEPAEDAIGRRAERELGLTVRDVELVVPNFRYRAVDATGIVENEVCPVYRAVAASPLEPRLDEVAEYAWVEPDALSTAVLAAPYAFSPWLALQLREWTPSDR